MTPGGRELGVPELSLVALVGISGSGKSSFAASHFLATEVLSSDIFRGMVSDDPNDQSATPDAFDVLYYIAGKRLAAGRLTVVDATNVRPEDRKRLVSLARDHDVLAAAIVLDLPLGVCAERNRGRPDRDFGPHVLRRQHQALRRSLRGLEREGFRSVHILRSPEEVAAATVVRTRMYNDLRHEAGPFDVVGDVHGCLPELVALLGQLGWVVERDEQGRAVGAAHPEGRRAVFLGDLVDRGPDTPGVLRLAMGMVEAGTAFAVQGNHEHKLLRALRGRLGPGAARGQGSRIEARESGDGRGRQKVQVTHGLAESLAQLEAETPEFRAAAERFIDGLISHYVLDGGRLVVAHAGLKEAYQGRASGRVRSFALYGETTGETDEFGLPVRYPWARDYRGRAMVLYGHTPTPEPEWVNNTMCLDTGVVFGGRLSALRYPERQVVSVPAERVWYEPAKPFPVNEGLEGAGPPAPSRREPDVLDISDVLGERVVETRHHGRLKVRAENAAAALEVMSRFAVDPRWLVYLPPTMAPVATSTRAELLEHPAEAFAAYRADGVDRVICEEKHMGSRAVALVCADEAAARRFGVDGGTGAVFTRTGRPFFDGALGAELVDRLRAAAGRAGLWEELDSGWLLLDCELLPWSAKAGQLLRTQYAAVGAAARAALPAALDAVTSANAAGVDAGGLLERLRARHANALAFTGAYRRYCWPTDGLGGVKLAPFQVLASEGAAHHGRDHLWHLGLAERLAGADPDLIAKTQSVVADTTDPASEASATAWWEELTAVGGEGMVVKPLANLLRGTSGLVQPGLKVRGREYLRIIYGPDYTEPANLERLRRRGLGRKRSLAAREYALGLEALDRLAAGEPLWRVHECVFAVLALESEPVDRRL